MQKRSVGRTEQKLEYNINMKINLKEIESTLDSSGLRYKAHMMIINFGNFKRLGMF